MTQSTTHIPTSPAAATLSPTAADPTLDDARRQVEAASRAWIETFNRGDWEGCAAGYTEDAAMEGRPLADVKGRAAIADFWKGVLAQDPGTLVYEDPRVHVLDGRTAVLSARWSMSRLGRGLITLERWQRGDDGVWRLAEDLFEITEQFGDR
ncbi:MAG: nuclear transport factor 2 family protein [Acidobacteriota bacterium]